mmetsp:Transcript_32714/g.104218  ORF Transcript_32714/g.104218 Transcript_32714/m.104218 type:complete len:213 (-) Transcript_32714:22-660(-)
MCTARGSRVLYAVLYRLYTLAVQTLQTRQLEPNPHVYCHRSQNTCRWRPPRRLSASGSSTLGTDTTANRRLTWRLTWLRRRTFRAHSFEEVLCLSARASPVRSAYRPIRHQLPTTRFVHAHDARRRLRRVEERVQLGVGCGEPLVVRTLHVVDIPHIAAQEGEGERWSKPVLPRPKDSRASRSQLLVLVHGWTAQIAGESSEDAASSYSSFG